MNQILIFIMSTILLNACATNKVKSTKLKDSATPYRVHDITLSPHQIEPIEYLMRHPEQKGLILAHYLGTGKTFIALAFAEKNPDKKVIILAPSFLESNWISHMQKMGIKNTSRYTFLSYENAAQKLPKIDLLNTIIIADEVHRFIEMVKSTEANKENLYSILYEHLKTANRLLLLSGTPVFRELSDIAYAINLAAGKDLLPYNDRVFLDQFTKIEKAKSIWRGHISESHLLMFTLPFVLAGIPLAFITPSIAMVGGLYFAGLGTGFTIMPILNWAIPLTNIQMRSFAAEKLSDISSHYVSFFDFRRNNDPYYPTQKIHEMSVSYNKDQIGFFIDFADLSLSSHNLARMTRETNYKISGHLDIQNTSVQMKLRDWPDSGREIGNFNFENNGKLIEAPKFEKILKIIGLDPKGVVIYSSYFENGIKIFADYLERSGLAQKYKILHPDLPLTEQIDIVNNYNTGKLPIILLHPTFTEGISLEGTRQLHILEPIPSQALFEQIVGRTIRYQSHAKLPQSQRRVDIYAWKATFDGFSAMLAKNDNWGKRYNELNSVASFGSGLAIIDPNFKRKQLSPDEFTELKRSTLKNAMNALNELFSLHSIEQAQEVTFSRAKISANQELKYLE